MPWPPDRPVFAAVVVATARRSRRVRAAKTLCGPDAEPVVAEASAMPAAADGWTGPCAGLAERTANVTTAARKIAAMPADSLGWRPK